MSSAGLFSRRNPKHLRQQSRVQRRKSEEGRELSGIGELELHPMYPEFCKRYMFNLPLFAAEVCQCVDSGFENNEITEQQFELMNAIQQPAAMVAVASGHGTGKTRSISIICLWHLLCFPQSNTLVTAPKVDQVRSHVWKEIHASVERMRMGTWAWIADYIEIFSRRVNIVGHAAKWFVKAKSAPKGAPENIAGEHNKYYLAIIDEATGVEDEILKKVDSALTQGDGNRMLMISQPSRNTGYFYEKHQKYNVSKGGNWTALTFNSEESRLVSRAILARKQLEYGGRDSREYCIAIRGIFPENDNGYLITSSKLYNSFELGHIIPPNSHYGEVLTIDLSSGEGRDYMCVNKFKVLGTGDYGRNARKVEFVNNLLYTNILKGKKAAHKIRDIALLHPDARIYIDEGGLGKIICQIVEELGVKFYAVNWGRKCINPAFKKRFQDQRAQCHLFMANAIEQGRLSFIDQRYKSEIVEQGSRLPYGYVSTMLKIPSKKDMKEMGIPSPDFMDTVAMVFLEVVGYDPKTASQGGRKTRAKTAAQAAKEVADEYF